MKTGKKNIVLSGIMIFLTHLSLLNAQEDSAVIINNILKNGVNYTMVDIESIATEPNLGPHQKALLKVFMLASVNDQDRINHAIAESSNYINSGDVEWAKIYMRMQRAFCYKLANKHDESANDFMTIIDAKMYDVIRDVDDPFIDSLERKIGKVDIYINDIGRKEIGYYLMRPERPLTDLDKAKDYFSGIINNAIRDDCLKQLLLRSKIRRFKAVDGEGPGEEGFLSLDDNTVRPNDSKNESGYDSQSIAALNINPDHEDAELSVRAVQKNHNAGMIQMGRATSSQAVGRNIYFFASAFFVGGIVFCLLVLRFFHRNDA